MTPTDTIIALEKALEAGPTQTEWSIGRYGEVLTAPENVLQVSGVLLPCGYVPDDHPGRLNAAFIAAANPLAIRTLLDAHASALRDAARYRWLVANNFDRQATQIHTWLSTWEPHSATGEPTEWRQRIHGSYLDVLIDAELSALDDNTKGAAE